MNLLPTALQRPIGRDRKVGTVNNLHRILLISFREASRFADAPCAEAHGVADRKPSETKTARGNDALPHTADLAVTDAALCLVGGRTDVGWCDTHTVSQRS